MENLKFISYLKYDNDVYLLHATKEKLTIFSREILNEMQVIRNFSKDITEIVPSNKNGVILVICENDFLFYFPDYTNLQTLMWKQGYLLSMNSFMFSIFSYDDEYIITYANNSFYIWKINYKRGIRDIIGIENIYEVAKIDKNVKINKILISPNDYVLAIKDQNNKCIQIWSFENFINKTNKINDIFPEQDQSNPNYFQLKQDNEIIDFLFRESTRNDSKKTPNTLITVDNLNDIRIWQEMILKDDIFFCHTNTIYSEKELNLGRISLNFINFRKKYWDIQKKISCLNNKDMFLFGNFESAPSSIDYLTVYDGKNLKFYELTNLRNYGNNIKITEIKQYIKKDEILNMIQEIHYIGFIRIDDKEIIELIIQNHKKNLLKIEININDESNLTIYNNSEYRLGKIRYTSFNKENNSFIVINDLNELIFLDSPNAFSLTSDYNRLLFYERKTHYIDNDLIKFFKFFFHSKEIVLFFDAKMSEIQIVLMFSFKIFRCSLSKFFNYSNIDIVQMTILNIIETQDNTIFTFIISDNQKLIKFNLQINVKILKESLKSQENIKMEECFIFNEYMLFTIEEKDHINFKTYFYLYSNQSFSLCIQYPKFLNTYKVEMNEIELIKQYSFKASFKDFEKTESTPTIIYFIFPNNEIEFFKEDGELICKFSIKELFFNIDQSLLDLGHIKLNFHHIYDRNFLLGVDNYFIIMSIYFDKKQQSFVIKYLTQSDDCNDLYYKRISRFSEPSNYQIFVGRNKEIFLKTLNSIKPFHGTFEKLVGDPESENFDSSNIHARLLKSRNNIPFHHPEFLYELLSIGKYNAVEYIFHEMIRSINQKKYVSSKFVIPLTEIIKQVNSTQPIDYSDLLNLNVDLDGEKKRNLSFMKKKSFIFSEDINGDEIKIKLNLEKELPFKSLRDFIDQNRKLISLKSYECILLDSLIEFCIQHKENQRSLDDFASIFLFYVKLFKITQRHIGNISKQKSLLTKEIAWALHTTQQDTLIQECVENSINENGDISWHLLKKYGVIIWFDNLEKIRYYVEGIAKTEFKKTKDPLSVMLWYMMLQKKIILINLFKQDKSQTKTYDFLKQNFSEPRWKNAASKNAYALLSKKNYEASAGFFLLGGFLSEAVNIIANNLQDIQLAMLCCKLLETGKEKPLFTKLIQTHFIESAKITNDCWLSHIGYSLLNQNINSVNCLYDFKTENNKELMESGNKVCLTWPKKFTPLLSSFHPSAFFLANKLRDSIKVKRELQQEDYNNMSKQEDIFESFWGNEEKQTETKEVIQKNQLKEDYMIHMIYSLEYFLGVNNPILGLLFFIANQEKIQKNKKIDDLIKKLLTKYTEFLLEEAVIENDWQQYFKLLFNKIQKLCEMFSFNPDILNQHCLKKIQLLRSLKLTSSYVLGKNNLDSAFDYIMEFCLETQKIYHYSLLSNFFCFNPRYFWLDLIYLKQELYFTLNLLADSEVFTKAYEINKGYDKIINVVECFLFFGLFYITTNLELWDLLLKINEEYYFFFDYMNSDNKKGAWLKEKNRVDYLIFFNDLRTKTTIFSELKLKDKKAHRYEDIICETFHSNIYKIEISKEKIEENDIKIMLLKIIIKYLCACYFSKLTLKQFEKVNNIYFQDFKYNKNQFSVESVIFFCNSFVNKMYLGFKTLFYKLSPLEMNSFVDEARNIFSNFENLSNSKMFKNCTTDNIMIVSLTKLSEKMKFESNFETMILKAQSVLFKTPNIKFSKLYEEEKLKYFKNGLEIIKIKESVKGLIINNYKTLNEEVMILTNRRFKKYSVMNQLINKTRTNDGITLLDEIENFNIEEKEILKEQLDNIENKPIVVKLAKKAIYGSNYEKNHDQKSHLFQNKYSYSSYWNLSDIEDIQNSPMSKGNYDFNDVQCFASHPNLPLFLTGSKGVVEMWSFNNLNMKLTDFKSSSKESYNVLKYNNSGEKFGAIDANGSFYLWKYSKYSKINKPIYSLLSSNKKYASDFCFLNENSIFATISINPKPSLSIWDILLPPNNNLIGSDQSGGTHLNYSSEKQMLILSNFKRGYVSFYDIRKNCVIKNMDFQNTELKSVLINKAENLFVCGTNDNCIKIIDLDQFEIINEIKPFKNDIKKKISINNLVQINNSILAVNTEGTVSLVYPSLL